MQTLESRIKGPVVTPSLSIATSPEAVSSAQATSIFESHDHPLGAESASCLPMAFQESCDPEKQHAPFTFPILDPAEPSNPDFASEQAVFRTSEEWIGPQVSEINSSWSFLDPACLDLETETHDLSDLDKQLEDEFPSITGGGHDISEELQAYDTTFFTFPDDHTLEVPSLTLLNAAMRVAQQLKISELIWDMAATSPFYQGSSASSSNSSRSPPSMESGSSTSRPSPANSGLQIDLTELPSHLQPTRTQRLIAHHPLLDLLPWPSTRDKLIQVFNLPIHMRPGNAQDPMGLVRFVYDVEDDSGEGLAITGQNPLEPGTWEIGQLVFERWWWAFDTSAVESSNRSRKNRGKARLRIEG